MHASHSAVRHRAVTILFVLLTGILAVGGSADGANAQGFISDVDVIFTSDPNWQPEAGNGWTKIPVDLNKGDGGDTYIFMVYRKDTGATALTSLDVVVGSGSLKPFPWYPVGDSHLNHGNSGDYLKLYATKTPSCQGIVEITVLEGEFSEPSDGWTKIPVDLNLGASGAYLWLVYRTEQLGAWL